MMKRHEFGLTSLPFTRTAKSERVPHESEPDCGPNAMMNVAMMIPNKIHMMRDLEFWRSRSSMAAGILAELPSGATAALRGAGKRFTPRAGIACRLTESLRFDGRGSLAGTTKYVLLKLARRGPLCEDFPGFALHSTRLRTVIHRSR
jgi:hypothetical protein